VARDRRDKRRRRQRSGLVEIANAILALFVLGLLAVGGVLFYGAQRFYAEADRPEEETFIVERGASLMRVAEGLELAGLVENRYIFFTGAYVLKKQSQIKAGEFNIPPRASMSEILKEITEGTPVQHAVTVPEGFTVWQAIDRLNGEDLLTGEIASLPPEGSILPQTYAYDRGAKREVVLQRMLDDMSKALADVWATCNPSVCGPTGPIKTQKDLLILASIVEKETGIASERPQVAAVFINRLKRGMRLQSDPTIIYGITKGASVLGRDLKKSEIEAKNDYNTYQMDGLPIGPIANPGIDALKAVANPAPTADLYFVAAGADPSQGHLFAPTYKQHQQNVAKYRAALRQAQRDEEAQAAKEALEEQQAEEAGEDVSGAPAN
jgi:UPF0755 protein